MCQSWCAKSHKLARQVVAHSVFGAGHDQRDQQLCQTRLQPALLSHTKLWLQGDPADTIPKLVSEAKAGLLVVDQSPVRLARSWREQVRAQGAGFRVRGCCHNATLQSLLLCGVLPVQVSSTPRAGKLRLQSAHLKCTQGSLKDQRAP